MGHRPPTRFALPPATLPAPVQVAQVLLLLGCAVFTASTLLRGDAGHVELLDTWLYDALTLTGAGLVAARARLVRVDRTAWALLAAALACAACGDVVYTFLLPPDAPSPSAADPFYLAFYPLTYVALLLLLRGKLRRLPTSVWLDGMVAGLALAAAAAALAFGPIREATGGSRSAVLVGLAYPLGDLLLLAVSAGALAVLGWRTEGRWLLLAAAFVLFAVADTAYLFGTAAGTYVEGTWIDALWPAATMLAARAAWRPTRQLADRDLHGRGVLLTPLVCTAVATALLVADHDLHLPRLAVVLAAGTLCAVAVRLALTFQEVSALAASRHEARTDELTGVANRRALLAALQGCTTTGRPAGAAGPSGPGLLLLDLDRFKEINDSLGHRVGDELLRQLAVRLSAAVRPQDLLARLGGDEFAVLLSPGTDLAAARSMAERLAAALQEPFPLDDVTLHMQASIGIALYPEHCTDRMQLLQRADVAMYAAKRNQSGIAVYRPADDTHSRARLEIAEQLRTAIERGELYCEYQPKVTLRDGSVGSVEALVRWQHPTRGALPPDVFLPLAEQLGLMRPLTLAVLDLALGRLVQWRALDVARELSVAVNLSVTSLLDADLTADVRRLLEAHRLPPSALILEITETGLMSDSSRAGAMLAELHGLGVGLSVDDYGTGYSSLAYLQDLPVDELKLDRAFVHRLTSDPRSAAIVRSTVDLAHSLGLRLVAEGVEDAATLGTLREFGCDIAQGYLHSRPLPAQEMGPWLLRHACRALAAVPARPVPALPGARRPETGLATRLTS